jgi:hypothetical protein
MTDKMKMRESEPEPSELHLLAIALTQIYTRPSAGLLSKIKAHVVLLAKSVRCK